MIMMLKLIILFHVYIEFQRMDYLPHQREHDTEPNIQWYPSEEQRAKRGKL